LKDLQRHSTFNLEWKDKTRVHFVNKCGAIIAELKRLSSADVKTQSLLKKSFFWFKGCNSRKMLANTKTDW